MVRDDIVGGLKVALSKGHSLQEAMQSFYNAGYDKPEIEEAARFLQSNNISSQSTSSIPISQDRPVQDKRPYSESNDKQLRDKRPIIKPNDKPIQFTMQKVSQYQDNRVRTQPLPKKKRHTFLIIFLIILLLLLIGAGVAIFIFKDEVLSFLNLG